MMGAGLAALLATGGCTEATVPGGLAGQYTATTFTVTQGGSTTNVLQAGGSLTMRLTSTGGTSGRLVVPASVSGGSALDASMDGSYTFSNGLVTFQQSADTFVRDMVFTAAGNTLSATQTFSGTTINIVLAR